MMRTPRPNAFFYEASRMVWGLFFRYYAPMSVEGRENIPTTGPLLAIGNHLSNLDVFLTGLLFKEQITYPAKIEGLSVPLMGLYIKVLGGFPVDRDIMDIGTARTIFAILHEKRILGIMPEGTRSLDGQVHEFKPGFVKIAIKTKTPILPIAIIGSEKVLPKWHWIPKRDPIIVRVGKLIELTEYYGKRLTEAKFQQIADDIRQIIIELHGRQSPDKSESRTLNTW